MKKALLVIDIQNNFYGKLRNKKRFTYQDPEQVIHSINKHIHEFSSNGDLVIYIAHIASKLFKYIFRINPNPDGDKLVPELNVASDYCFEKTKGDAFSVVALQQLLKEKEIDHVTLCGIDEAGCVFATANGAMKLNYKVEILTDATDTVFINRAKKCREKLKRQGVIFSSDHPLNDMERNHVC